MIIQENTIIHGDSLTVLRQMEPESVDAIITDPPYGINYVSQTGASIKNDKSPFIWFLYDAFRVLKSGEAGRGGLICFTRWDVEQTFIDAMKIAGFNVKSEVIWDKVACSRKEASCIIGSLLVELAPVCEKCGGVPDGVLNLQTEAGLSLTGDADVLITGHSIISGKPVRIKLTDYGFEYYGDHAELARVREKRCVYHGRAVSPTKEN